MADAPSEITLNMEFKELVLRTRNEGSIRNLEADRTRTDSCLLKVAAGDGESEGTNTATSSEDNITEKHGYLICFLKIFLRQFIV